MQKSIATAVFVLIAAVAGASLAADSDDFLGTWNWDSAIGKTELKIEGFGVEEDGVTRVEGHYVPLDHTQHRSVFWSDDGSTAKLNDGVLHILLKGTGSTFRLRRWGDELAGIFTRKGQDADVTFYREE